MTIDTSPAALRKLYDEYLGDYENTKVMRGTLLAIAAEKEAQAKQEPFAFVQYVEGYQTRLFLASEFSGMGQREWPSGVTVHPLYLAPQHHPEQPLEMVATADVPLPEPDRIDDRESESAWSQSLMHQYAEAYAKAAVAAEREMRDALELIAAPKRPDGTWNRDREACRQLAAEALGRYDKEQKGTV